MYFKRNYFQFIIFSYQVYRQSKLNDHEWKVIEEISYSLWFLSRSNFTMWVTWLVWIHYAKKLIHISLQGFMPLYGYSTCFVKIARCRAFVSYKINFYTIQRNPNLLQQILFNDSKNDSIVILHDCFNSFRLPQYFRYK